MSNNPIVTKLSYDSRNRLVAIDNNVTFPTSLANQLDSMQL